MITTEESNTQKRQWQEASADSSHILRQQVAEDLLNKLAEFPDQRKGLKVMASMMGIHEKTLRRLMDSQNKPGYQTLLKIYRTLYHTTNDTRLLELVPAVVRESLLRSHPRGMEVGVNYSLDVEAEINRDPVFCEIYTLCGTGGITKEYVSYHYGRYGERLLQKMIDQEVVTTIDKNKFILGNNQATLGVETLKSMSLHMIDSFSKPENMDSPGENYITFTTEALNEEAYNQWIRIDEEALREKVKIASNPINHGDIKAFTIQVIDTLSPSKKETKH